MTSRGPSSSLCPLCGGHKAAGTATWTADLGFGVLVVRKVSATVCDQCGEEWIGDETARRLEQITSDARRQHRPVEVVAY